MMDKIDKKMQQYDQYLSFLGRKISLLEDILGRISPSKEIVDYVSSLPTEVKVIPDSISEFKAGWGVKEYDARGNPYRKMNLDIPSEIRFPLNLISPKKITLKVYCEIEHQFAYFVNYEQVVPKISKKENIYEITFDVKSSYYQHDLSLILVCPVSDRDKFSDTKTFVFVSLSVK